ncbi:alpha/beta fold hydrolase [Gordonia sp. (in: high G+C Gram-positive bacteria)]|uniref:alpha/beta fold hydrolase n=1 Tax=Gordonia sp. (in: high G+C Gram-positive bacteria) TaxID=84139 RepID=UPI003C70E84B
MSVVTIEANGLEFRAHTAGDQKRPVLFLHGFPQDGTAWTETMHRIAEAGYGAVAPDLRGYSPGQQSLPRQAYGVSTLVRDVAEIIQTYEAGPLHVVGHDWGGSLLWSLRRQHPNLIASATVVSSPHPADLNWALTHSRQALQSWYIAAIALPGLPELVLRSSLSRFLRSTGLPHDRADYYQQRMQAPGAATAALAWYRQMIADTLGSATGGEQTPPHPDTYPPTQYLWGVHDAFLGKAAAHRTRDRIKDLSFVEVPDGGHWLPETHPELIADSVLDLLG